MLSLAIQLEFLAVAEVGEITTPSYDAVFFNVLRTFWYPGVHPILFKDKEEVTSCKISPARACDESSMSDACNFS